LFDGDPENISGISKGFGMHFGPRAGRPAPKVPAMLHIRPYWFLLSAAVLTGLPVRAQAPAAQSLDPAVIAQVQQLAQLAAAAAAPKSARVDVQVGQLAPQLKLAACRQIQPYLPQGLHMWGRSRIGLKCVDGLAKWNVSVPVQVKVYAKALVAQGPLVTGSLLTQENLATAEIDIAAEPGAVFTDAEDLAGRSLSRSLEAGQAVRSTSLAKRRWFEAGDTVQVKVSGDGYAIAADGQALSVGLEGSDARVRMESGRTVTGRVVGERRVEVVL